MLDVTKDGDVVVGLSLHLESRCRTYSFCCRRCFHSEVLHTPELLHQLAIVQVQVVARSVQDEVDPFRHQVLLTGQKL